MSRTKTWQKRLRAKKEAEKARAAAERTAEAAAQAALEESHLKHRAWPPDEEELHRLACMESSESEAEAEAFECDDGALVPRSAPPRSAEAPLHALAGKTLRLQYALSVDKAELVVKHLLAVAYAGDAVAVDALAKMLPRTEFPERVVRPGGGSATEACGPLTRARRRSVAWRCACAAASTSSRNRQAAVGWSTSGFSAAAPPKTSAGYATSRMERSLAAALALGATTRGSRKGSGRSRKGAPHGSPASHVR